MIPVSREISDLKDEFEGGASLAVDFYRMLRRAANTMLSNVNPETLKRRVPIYGGIGRNLFTYYIPDDVEVPSAIYAQPEDRTTKFSYVPPNEFYSRPRHDTFTIEYINGARFGIFRHSIAPASRTLNQMDTIVGVTSDGTLTLNEYNKISGIGALQRTFTAETGTPFTADSGTDTFTANGHGFEDGDRVMVVNAGGSLPVGLTNGLVYFIVNKTDDTFQLSLTSGGSVVLFSTNGTGSNFVHDAAQNEMSGTFDTALDLTDYQNGIVIIPMVFENAHDIERVILVLEEDEGNYRTMSSVQDSVGDRFIDGLNMVRLWLPTSTKTGNPSDALTAKWRLRVVLKVGAPQQTVIVNKITLQRTNHFYLEYYSNRMFVDGITGSWKETPAKGDFINLERNTADILHYEATILISQSATFIKEAGKAFGNFTDQLARAYRAYWARNPSTEQPLSYNHMDDVYDLPDFIGDSMHAQQNIEIIEENADTNTLFADNEVPAGTIDGTNATFLLDHAPNPINSLMIWLNGTYQTLGVDYNISGRTITFVTPPAVEYAGLPFVAFYRYTL